MRRVRLIHWKITEAEERAGSLQAAGYEVAYESLDSAGLRELRENPPSAVVIDLSRVPSQGRDVALGIRKYKATRRVPLVFVDGDPVKVARVREILPDAVYTSWSQIGDALQHAIANPPGEPVVPDSTMAGYAGTPLPKKLGIKANAVVALVGAPDQFEETLGELPEGVVLRRQACSEPGVTLWFTRSRDDLVHGLKGMITCAETGPLWIAWPKKASGVASDLSQTVVRELGLAAGLVDYNVCAIDATWSGLCFARRKRKPK